MPKLAVSSVIKIKSTSKLEGMNLPSLERIKGGKISLGISRWRMGLGVFHCQISWKSMGRSMSQSKSTRAYPFLLLLGYRELTIF